MATFEQLQAQYTEAGQGHIFRFADKLSSSEKAQFASQLRAIDPTEIEGIVAKAQSWKSPQSDVEPLPAESTASLVSQDDQQTSQAAEWMRLGHAAIRDGKVAVLLLAGGQGTRLGSSSPKGCYDIGLPSHKSLFQLQAERIAKLGGLPWYIMTSGPTREPTERFFKKNNHFGLSPSDVIFFEQGIMPCVTEEGKIILESAGRVAVAPDGNGGVYKALKACGVLEDMQRRGIEHVHMYCVDNSLVKVADPTFIGFCAAHAVDVAVKVVRKRSPDEKVGVIAARESKPAVIEYSEISEELRSARDAADPELLKLRAANIVNHYYTLDFLLRAPALAKTSMPFHIAHKKIPFAGSNGTTEKPSTPNGIKLEQFVFDIFGEVPLAKFAALEVARQSEFSPVKNAPGSKEDCPETARDDLMREGQRWLLAAGAKSAKPVEIAASVSYNGEGLSSFSGQEVTQEYIKN